MTSLKLPSNLKLTYTMVGISNLKEKDSSGVKTLSVEYILISNGPQLLSLRAHDEAVVCILLILAK